MNVQKAKIVSNKQGKIQFIKAFIDKYFSEQLTTDDNRDEIDWEERAIGQKTWQRRQRSAEYDDMISTESSVHKKPLKRSKKHETQSEIFENSESYNSIFKKKSF